MPLCVTDPLDEVVSMPEVLPDSDPVELNTVTAPVVLIVPGLAPVPALIKYVTAPFPSSLSVVLPAAYSVDPTVCVTATHTMPYPTPLRRVQIPIVGRPRAPRGQSA